MKEQAILNKASEYFSTREYARSRRYIDRLFKSPKKKYRAVARLNKAILLQIQGRFLEADQLILRALELDPKLVSAIPARAINRKFTEKDGYHEQILANLKDAKGDHRIRLLFALGKCYDDMGWYDEAFEAITEGNELKRKTVDPTRLMREVEDYIEELYDYCIDEGTSDYLSSLGGDNEQMVFIVGMPRSGTTLLESALDKHPNITGTGESLLVPPLFGELCDSLHEPRKISFKPLLRAKDVKPYAERYLSEVVKGKGLFIDKNPMNHRYMAWMQAMFPKAKVIHVKRNPMDTLLSCYFRLFEHNMEWSFTFEEMAQAYSQYQRIMAHARKYLSIPILDVYYEELVIDKEKTIKRVLEFLGEPFDEKCLDTRKTGETITASMWQVRQPVYDSSVGKWRNYERHLEPLRKLIN